jgi:hypothetical protein
MEAGGEGGQLVEPLGEAEPGRVAGVIPPAIDPEGSLLALPCVIKCHH